MPDIGIQKSKTKKYQSCSCNDKASTCRGTCLCSKRNKSPASTALKDIISNVINITAEKRKALSCWTIEDVVREAIEIGENKNAANSKGNKSSASITLEDIMSNGINTIAEIRKAPSNWTVEDVVSEASTIGENRNAAKTVDETPITNQASSLRVLIDRIKDITINTFDMTAIVGEAYRTSNDQTRTVNTIEATNDFLLKDAHKIFPSEKYVGSYLKNLVRKALHICSKRDKAICTDTGRHIVWRAACIGAKKDQVICASLLNKTVDNAARIAANKNKTVINIDKTATVTDIVDKPDKVNTEKVKAVCSNAAKLVVSKALYFGAQRITGICSSLIRDIEEEAINNSTRKHIIWKAAIKRTNKGTYKAMRPLYLSKEKLGVEKNIIISDSSLRQLVCVATCISKDTAITDPVRTLVDTAIDNSVEKDKSACLGAVTNAANAAVDVCEQTCKSTCSDIVRSTADEAVDICTQNECCLEEDETCTCNESNFEAPKERKKIVCPATGGECPFKPNRDLSILPVLEESAKKEEEEEEKEKEEESFCPCPKKGAKKTVATRLEQNRVASVSTTVRAPAAGVKTKVICPATGGICPFKPNGEPKVFIQTEEDISCHCLETDNTIDNNEEENPSQSCEVTCPTCKQRSVCPSTGGDCPKKVKNTMNKSKTGRKKDASVSTCPTTGGLCPYIKRLRQFKVQSKGDERCPPTCTARKRPDNEEKSCQSMDTSSDVHRKICYACSEPCGEFCPDD